MQIEDQDTEQQSAEQQIKEQPIARDWKSLIAPWWTAMKAILPIFLGTRFVFLLLTYFGVVLFTVPNYSPTPLPFKAVSDGWYHWDVIRFVTIADKGYISLEYAAFFPLFPWLEHLVSIPFSHNAYLAGMLISNAAFLGTLTVLYRFVETEWDRETALRTAIYLSVFPTALFFFAAYNESLFLFFMLLMFYALRRRSWWLAGLFGGLATLTRSIGLLLAVVFLYEYIRQEFPGLLQTWRAKAYGYSLRLLSGLPAIALIPLAIGIYAYYLNSHLHDPLAFLHAQIFWREGIHGPWYGPYIALKSIFTLSPFIFATPHDIIDLSMLLIFLVLLVLCFVGPEKFSKEQWSLPIFGALALIYATLFPGAPGGNDLPYDPLPSMGRFVLEIIPGFILLARLGRRQWFHQNYLLVALPMLTFFTLQFLTGRWMV